MIFGTVIHAEHTDKAIMMAKSIKKHMPNGKVIIGVMEETMPNAAFGCPYFDEVVLMKDTDAYSNMKSFFPVHSSRSTAGLQGFIGELYIQKVYE